MLIHQVIAKKIKDSRGQNTIEVTVNDCKASSPSGKSTGKYETPSYHKSLAWNIKAIHDLKITKEITSFSDLESIEKLIKKTFKLKDAKQFGANALFALESAILKALAKSQKKELWQIVNPKAKKIPVPVGNAIGGGLHSYEENHPIFQEFLLIPKEISISKNVKIMNQMYKEIGKLINSKKINDEGAWETAWEEEKVLQLLSKFKSKVNIGIDSAASTFYKNNSYKYNDKILTREEHIDYMNEIINRYNIFYVEDPLQEEDFLGFKKINSNRIHRIPVLITGDDLTATHTSRLKKAIKSKAINAMIIKPNQNGSLIELKKIIDICKKHNIKTILSHRSGETLDPALADYAFGFQTDFIKSGIATKWRESKLKRLIEIEKSLRR